MQDSPLVSALYKDVQNLVNARGSLLHSRPTDSTFRKVERYIMRNKAKISSGVVKTIAAGLLTGGIGAAVVVGGSAVVYVGKRLFRRAQSSVATANIAIATQIVGGTTSTVDSASTRASIKEVNYQHSFVLSEVATLCSNNAMTDIMTAFIELDEDGKALSKIMPNRSKKDLVSCDEAWSLLEHVERIKLREADLADAMGLFQDLIEYIVLVTSSYQDDPTAPNHFELRRARAVKFIIDKCPGLTMDQKKAAALQLLNDEANSSDVFHSRIFSKNFTGWIIQHNPEFGTTRTGGMPIISNGESTITGAATKQAMKGTAINSVTLGAGTGSNVLYNAANQGDLLNNVTSASKGLAESALSSVAASATSSGIGIVSDVIFLSLAKYIDKQLLEKYRTALNMKISEDEKARKSGLAQKPLMELFAEVDSNAVATLRTNAKQIVAIAAEKLKHLVAADQELNGINSGATSAGDLAKKLMRRQKLQDQVDELKPLLFLFHEYTTVRAMHIVSINKALEIHIKESIISFVDHHPPLSCFFDRHVCYMDSGLCFSQEIAGRVKVTLPQGVTEDSLRKQLAGRPIHPGPKGEGGLRKVIDKYC